MFVNRRFVFNESVCRFPGSCVFGRNGGGRKVSLCHASMVLFGTAGWRELFALVRAAVANYIWLSLPGNLFAFYEENA